MSDRGFLVEQVESRPLGMAIMRYFIETMGPEIIYGIQEDVDVGYSPSNVSDLLSSVHFDPFVVECGWVYAQLYQKGVIRLNGRDGGQANDKTIDEEE